MPGATQLFAIRYTNLGSVWLQPRTDKNWMACVDMARVVERVAAQSVPEDSSPPTDVRRGSAPGSAPDVCAKERYQIQGLHEGSSWCALSALEDLRSPRVILGQI